MHVNKMMVIKIRLASSELLTILKTDVFLRIAKRLAPQAQITFLGIPLKPILALAVVFLDWQLFTDELGHEVCYWLSCIKITLKVFKTAMDL